MSDPKRTPPRLTGDPAQPGPEGTRPRRWPYYDICDELVKSWQEFLKTSREAQEFLRRRGLWVPAVLERLKVGFVARPWYPPPASSSLRRQLSHLRILDERGRQIPYQRLVVPYFDRQGFLAGVYGYSVSETGASSPLYPPSELFGVFNPDGIPEEGTVLMAMSVLDALTLLALGFENVTSGFGEEGLLAADLAHLLKARRVRRVVCVYPQWVEEFTFQWIARGLSRHGVELSRALVPDRDLNTWVIARRGRPEVEALLGEAKPVELSRALWGETA